MENPFERWVNEQVRRIREGERPPEAPFGETFSTRPVNQADLAGLQREVSAMRQLLVDLVELTSRLVEMAEERRRP